MRDRLDRRRALRFICAAVSAPAVAAIGTQGAAAAADDGRASPPVMQGYGACANCNCPGFTGSQMVCGNCGHNYQAHW